MRCTKFDEAKIVYRSRGKGRKPRLKIVASDYPMRPSHRIELNGVVTETRLVLSRDSWALYPYRGT